MKTKSPIIALQNTLNFCPCCAANIRLIPTDDLNFCFKCGTNMRSIRLAVDFSNGLADVQAVKPSVVKQSDSERNEMITKLRDEGKSIKNIARELHLAKKTVAAVLKGTVKKRTRIKSVTPELREKVMESYASLLPGESKKSRIFETISERLGISTTTVHRIVKSGVETSVPSVGP